MLKKTLFAMAAVAAVSGAAMALQATPAQAAVAAPAIAAAQAVEGGVIEVGHRRGWRHRYHRRCYFVRKKVRGYYGWHWKRVRICRPHRHWKHHRRHHRRHYY